MEGRAAEETQVAPIDDTLLGEGSRRVGQAAGALGYGMEWMPKAIDPAKCRKCGTCGSGCQFEAKWTALDYLHEVAEHGAELVYNSRVLEVLVEPGRARGVKTADELEGRVYPDGTFSKPVTERDWTRLNEGASISAEILGEAGADPKSILVSKPQGAHPGGTAAIGQVVDRDLQTEVGDLFVCDASVLPKAPGLPPILTLVALAKRLARTLAA